MKHNQIVKILESSQSTDIKYNQLVTLLCGKPFFEIELTGLKGRCTTKNFNSLSEMNKYYEKLSNRKYPIFKAKIFTGYKNEKYKCYWVTYYNSL